ncbi:hypothetical protein BGZ96_004914 [Linnemannia gamsii]|uniref:BHLH domain-containing protein n=1 Tax=Linnemannia gamsii TaxID=64522 RepID=A0ABQ7K4Z9_9FUNG|nr:hypothetical protein BGZ96_004914 [Linnemannia gamsii]
MYPSHSTFVPELDLNPPTSWSKPASALGLSNPVNHLPQSQQILRLQQQIQHHRQLQRSAQAPIKIRRTHSNGSNHDSTNNNASSKNQQRAGASVSPTTPTAASPTNPSIDSTEMFGNYATTQGQGFGSGDRASAVARSNNNNPHYRHSLQFGSNGHVQHINIRNTDEDDDEDLNDNDDSSMSGTEHDDTHSNSSMDNRGGMDIKMKMTSSGAAFQHHRSMSHPDFSRGFNTALHGFTPITTESSHSPPSPPTGSYTSEGNGFSAAMVSPGMMTQSSHSGGLQFDGGSGFQGNSLSRSSSMGAGGVESSLASLADLSVMSSMPGLVRRPSTSSSGSNSSTFPFQPQQGLPVIYQNQATFNTYASSRGPNNHYNFNDNISSTGANSISGLTSALGQQLQRQQMFQEQQQQQNQYHAFPSSGPTLSASLPAPSSFQPYYQQMSQSDAQKEQEQQEQPQAQQQADDDAIHEDRRRSRSKSATLVPPPRRALPPRPPQTSAPRKYLGRQARKVPIVNEVKEVTTPTRRMAHILSEQKRREKINGGFDELKSVIPECAENTDSKASILRKAVDYICLLEDELRRYAEVFEREGRTKDEFDD